MHLPSNAYSQQHLTGGNFSLTNELAKQRKHLELHMEHHHSLAVKASEMYRNIQGVLPQYIASQKDKGKSVVTYEDWRRKELLKHK